MNNDLEQFSEERLKKLIISAEGVTFPTFFELQANDTAALARIALSVKRSEVVAYMTYKGHLLHAADPKVLEHSDPQPLYDTPQPAHTERDSWIKCSDRMPEVGDVVITAYQGATNIGEMERSGRDYRYFTSIASGRELPADFWMPLPAAPKPESE